MSLPIYDTQKMTEFLRRLVIKFFLDEKIINERKALESPARKPDQQKRAIATDNKFCYHSGTGAHVIIVCEGSPYQLNSDIAVGGKEYLSGEPLPMEKLSTPCCATMGKLSKLLK